MGMSHVALAVKDMAATHHFYTEAMGFELRKVEVVPQRGGFARHAFYSTGSDVDQLIAFWDLANVPDLGDFRTDICLDLGLDPLTNHVAFQASGADDLAARRQRWLDHGLTVMEIDHGWIHSIYTTDPDGIAVEFAYVSRPFTNDDAEEAHRLLFADAPPMSDDEPVISFHEPEKS